MDIDGDGDYDYDDVQIRNIQQNMVEILIVLRV